MYNSKQETTETTLEEKYGELVTKDETPNQFLNAATGRRIYVKLKGTGSRSVFVKVRKCDLKKSLSDNGVKQVRYSLFGNESSAIYLDLIFTI